MRTLPRWAFEGTLRKIFPRVLLYIYARSMWYVNCEYINSEMRLSLELYLLASLNLLSLLSIFFSSGLIYAFKEIQRFRKLIETLTRRWVWAKFQLVYLLKNVVIIVQDGGRRKLLTFIIKVKDSQSVQRAELQRNKAEEKHGNAIFIS